MQNDYQKQCHSERSEDGLLRTPSEKSRIHKVGVTEILRYALDDKMIGNFYYDTPSSCGEFDCICKLNSPTSFPPDFAFSRGSGEFLFLPTKIQNIYYFDNQSVTFLNLFRDYPYLKGELIIKEQAGVDYIDNNDPLSMFINFAFNGYTLD